VQRVKNKNEFEEKLSATESSSLKKETLIGIRETWLSAATLTRKTLARSTGEKPVNRLATDAQATKPQEHRKDLLASCKYRARSTTSGCFRVCSPNIAGQL